MRESKQSSCSRLCDAVQLSTVHSWLPRARGGRRKQKREISTVKTATVDGQRLKQLRACVRARASSSIVHVGRDPSTDQSLSLYHTPMHMMHPSIARHLNVTVGGQPTPFRSGGSQW